MTGEVGGPPIQACPGARSVPLVVWAARLTVYFLLQGALLLLAYAYYGFDTDPQSFPPGQRLDPLHAAVHLDTPVNLFHWSLVCPAWAIGLYGLWRERHPR